MDGLARILLLARQRLSLHGSQSQISSSAFASLFDHDQKRTTPPSQESTSVDEPRYLSGGPSHVCWRAWRQVVIQQALPDLHRRWQVAVLQHSVAGHFIRRDRPLGQRRSL